MGKKSNFDKCNVRVTESPIGPYLFVWKIKEFFGKYSVDNFNFINNKKLFPWKSKVLVSEAVKLF